MYPYGIVVFITILLSQYSTNALREGQCEGMFCEFNNSRIIIIILVVIVQLFYF